MLLRSPGERFDLEVEMHGDLAGLLDVGGGFQGETEIFVLNLRDGEWVAKLREQAGGGDSVDGDAGER